jgi:hypothetical protein
MRKQVCFSSFRPLGCGVAGGTKGYQGFFTVGTQLAPKFLVVYFQFGHGGHTIGTSNQHDAALAVAVS